MVSWRHWRSHLGLKLDVFTIGGGDVYNRTMTPSTIYQLIGRSYLEGVSHGMQKAAAFEKQALSPKHLLEMAEMAKALGRGRQSLNLLGGARGRHVGQMLTELGTNAENVAKVVPGIRPKDAGSIVKYLLNKEYKGATGTAIANMLEAGKKYMPDYIEAGKPINKYMEHFGKGFLHRYKPKNAITPTSSLTL